MGIKERIKGAKLLIANGLHNDALILILIAIAASSRKEFSRATIKHDAEAFKTFLKNGIEALMYGEDNAGSLARLKLTYSPAARLLKREEHTIDELIYEQYRCYFVHEGELPIDVLFTNDSIPIREMVRVNLYDESHADILVTNEEILIMTHNWLDILIKVVEEAVINNDLFGPTPSHINDGYPAVVFTSIKAS